MHEREFKRAVRLVCDEIADLLISKNEAYGNSVFDPVRVFSQADVTEQIRVRIDDKISRIARGKEAGEDSLTDLIGYLVLLKVSSLLVDEKEEKR